VSAKAVHDVPDVFGAGPKALATLVALTDSGVRTERRSRAVRKFYQRNNCREERIQRRLEDIRRGVSATWDQVVIQSSDRRTAGETCALLLALLAEGHLTRRPFGSMLRMIAALPLPDG